MDNFNKSILELAEKKNLYPAERIILDKLKNYENIVSSTLDEKLFNETISAFQSLMKINSGNLSLQCSCSIGHCISLLLQKNSQFNFEQSLNRLLEDPKQSTLFAIGIIIKENESKMENLLPTLVSNLIAQSFTHVDPVLFSLKYCFSRNIQSINQYIEPTIHMLKKAINSDDDTTLMYSLKLLIKLTKISTCEPDDFLIMAKSIYEKTKSLFVIEYVCRFVAFIAFSVIRHDGSDKNMKRAIQIIVFFPNEIYTVFKHFLPLLNIDFIQFHIELITNFILDYCPVFLSMISKMLLPIHRQNLYKYIEHQEFMQTQLQIFNNLCWDQQSAFNVATIAYEMASSPDKEKSIIGSSFFFNLYEQNHELAGKFLESATTFLALPPEGLENMKRNIIAKALIAAHIISSTEIKQSIISSNEKNINTFLQRALEEAEVFDIEFAAGFILMSALPPENIPLESVFLALKSFRAIFKDTPISTPEMKEKSQFLGECVSIFLAGHPYIAKADKTFLLMLNHDTFNSRVVALAAFLAFPKMQSAPSILLRIVAKLQPIILTIDPLPEFLDHIAQKPMISKRSLLDGIQLKIPKFPSAFLDVPLEDLTIRIVQNFSDYVKAIPESNRAKMMEFLFKNETPLKVSIVLINALLKNEITAKIFDHHLLKFMIGQIYETETNRKIQIISENIAMYLNYYYNEEQIKLIISKCQSISVRFKCIVYGSIFGLSRTVDTSYLYQMMMEVMALMKDKRTAPYALYSLSNLFNEHFTLFTDQAFTVDQFTFLLNIIHTPISTDTYTLYYMGLFFKALLSVCAGSSLSNNIDVIKEILEAFRMTKFPFARKVYFNVLRTVMQVVPYLMQKYENEYPHVHTMSLSSRLNTVGLYADLISLDKAPKQFDLYFSRIPHVLLLLQLTEDQRAADFVLSVAHLFTRTRHEDDLYIRIQNAFLKTLKAALVDGIITGIGKSDVDAKTTVKECLLDVARVLVNKTKISIAKENWKSDFALCGLTPINRNEQKLTEKCYQLLVSVVETFGIKGIEELLAKAANKGFASLKESTNFMQKFYSLVVEKKCSNEVYDIFFNGMERIMTIIPQFLPTFNIIVKSAVSNPEIMEIFMKYSEKLVEHMQDFVASIMLELDENHGTNLVIGELYYGWREFFESIVALQEKCKIEIVDYQSIVSFCCDEILRTQVQWRIDSAINGIKAVLEKTEKLDENSKLNIKNVLNSPQKLKADDIEFMKQFVI